MIKQYDRGIRVENFKFPVLIICGEDDYLYTSENAKDLKDKIFYCTVSTISKTGHSFILENPREIIQTIDNFLKNKECLSKNITLNY